MSGASPEKMGFGSYMSLAFSDRYCVYCLKICRYGDFHGRRTIIHVDYFSTAVSKIVDFIVLGQRSIHAEDVWAAWPFD